MDWSLLYCDNWILDFTSSWIDPWFLSTPNSEQPLFYPQELGPARNVLWVCKKNLQNKSNLMVKNSFIGQVACCNNRSQSSSPRQPHSQPDPVLNTVIVITVCWKPIKSKEKKKYSFMDSSSGSIRIKYKNKCTRIIL